MEISKATVQNLSARLTSVEKTLTDLIRDIKGSKFWKNVATSLFGIVMFLAGSTATIYSHQKEEGHPVIQSKVQNLELSTAIKYEEIKDSIYRLEGKIDSFILSQTIE